MSFVFAKGYDASTVSEELLEVVSNAYAHQGTVVEIPSTVIENSRFDLSSETTDEIMAIRRRERTVSTQTLSFSFA